MTPDKFAAKWKVSTLKERSACQSHFNDLCNLRGVEKPTDAEWCWRSPDQTSQPSAEPFVAHNISTGGQQTLDHSQAEGKTQIDPDDVGDHLGRKPVVMIERILGACSYGRHSWKV
jgi:hypothetical protein